MKTKLKQSEKELSKQFEKDMIEVGDCTVLCLKALPKELPPGQLVFIGSQLMALALSEVKSRMQLEMTLHFACKVLKADALKFYEAKVKYEKTKNNSI